MIVTCIPKMNGLIASYIKCTVDAGIYRYLYVHACNMHAVIAYIRDMHVTCMYLYITHIHTVHMIYALTTSSII